MEWTHLRWRESEECKKTISLYNNYSKSDCTHMYRSIAKEMDYCYLGVDTPRVEVTPDEEGVDIESAGGVTYVKTIQKWLVANIFFLFFPGASGIDSYV